MMEPISFILLLVMSAFAQSDGNNNEFTVNVEVEYNNPDEVARISVNNIDGVVVNQTIDLPDNSTNVTVPFKFNNNEIPERMSAIVCIDSETDQNTIGTCKTFKNEGPGAERVIVKMPKGAIGSK